MSTSIRGTAHGLPYVIEPIPDVHPALADIYVGGVHMGRILEQYEGGWWIEYRGGDTYATMDDAAVEVCRVAAEEQMNAAHREMSKVQRHERDAEWKRVLRQAERTIKPETAHERGNHE